MTLSHHETDAGAALQEAGAILAATTAEDGPVFGILLLEEARLAEARGDPSGSHQLLKQSAAILSRRLPPRHPDRVAALAQLGQ